MAGLTILGLRKSDNSSFDRVVAIVRQQAQRELEERKKNLELRRIKLDELYSGLMHKAQMLAGIEEPKN